ncbi:MAG: hypothetical protein DRQ51_08720 [Gammaproteobacteria bacterium]|nr:MAG: hypothetical protein DRQ51_08720 [Gammaproteobacteria bacterium]
MQTLQLQLKNNLYHGLLQILSTFPKGDYKIIKTPNKTTNTKNINDYYGKIDSFKNIDDPVEWQKKIRAEWDRDWDK